MRRTILLSCLMVGGVGWWMQHREQAQLLAQAEALRAARYAEAALRVEADQLRTRQAQASAPLAESSAPETPPASPPPQTAAASPQISVAQWAPADSWRNRGLATPRATVETALWAAAGGDVAAFEHTLEISAEVRDAAAALLAQLPENGRALYGTPENLIAAFTIKNIPTGAAQVVWYQESSPDETMIGLFLKNPPKGATDTPDRPASETAPPAPEPRAPPQLTDNSGSSSAYLTLRRGAMGWRLVVPLAAVKDITEELKTLRLK